jgi:hypothetical protein
METITTILTSAATGAIAAYVTTLFESRRKIDDSVRDARLKTYPQLWNETGLVPRWPKAEVTYDELHSLSMRFQEWYYNSGGMYLSRQARQAYGTLQELITRLCAPPKKERLTDPHYDEVRDAASVLRNELTNDLMTRTRTVAFRGRGEA